MGGKLWDIVYMDCLATELISPVLSQTLVPDELRLQTDPKTGGEKEPSFQVYSGVNGFLSKEQTG
jgi:hypothetical protein